MSGNFQIEVVVKTCHSTLKDYFIVFIVNTVTCSMSCFICCLSLFAVRLISLFIMFRFFATGYIYSGEIKIWKTTLAH